jgi:hypothetical protein
MIIKKGQQVEVKGTAWGRWKLFEAKEEFNTGDERWKLWDPEENKVFEPLGERCEIRIISEDGSKQKVLYKKDSEVWDVIKDQISKSKVKRYSWELILGESLTKTILRHKMKGLSSVETYHVIIEHPMVQKITQFFPEYKARLHEKIYISVCARFGENNSALSLYNKEFRGKQNE